MTRLSAGDPMPVGNHRLSSIQTCASVHPQLAGSAPNLVGAVRRRRRRPGSRQHLRTDPGTGALGTGVGGDSSSVSRAKPAAVRFYFDADMFGLANPCLGNESTSPFLATPMGGSRSGSATL